MRRPLTLILEDDLSHNEAGKEEFRLAGRDFLKSVANIIGVQSGTYDLHWLAGGPHVSGDVVLVSPSIYLHLTQRWPADTSHLLVRRIEGKANFKKGRNIWIDNSKLESTTLAANSIIQALELEVEVQSQLFGT